MVDRVALDGSRRFGTVKILYADSGNIPPKDGAVYIGAKGSDTFLPFSWFAEAFSKPWNYAVERKALVGRALIIPANRSLTDKDVIEFIKFYCLDGASHRALTHSQWRCSLRMALNRGSSVGHAGIALKCGVLAHPASLGNFARLFQVSPAQALAGAPEAFPVWIAEWEADEIPCRDFVQGLEGVGETV